MRAQELETRVTCCHHQHSAIEEYLLCPCCVSGTVLEVNKVDPAFSPREHSLHLHFALRLIDLMGKGEAPHTHCHLPHPFQNIKSRAGRKKDRGDVCNTVKEPGNGSLLRSCRALPLPQAVRTGGREMSRGRG